MILRLSIALVCLLGVAPATASAFGIGDDLTGLPQIDQALSDARSYWHGQQPTCPSGIRVSAADLSGEGEAGEAAACALTLDLAWLNSSPSRTQYCALVTHEYGHLLGYGHDTYSDDTDHVMSAKTTPRYCRTFNVLPDSLPKACRWPAWARTTPQIRRFYAAGRKRAALVAYRSWRKRHPKAALPAACQAATS